MESKEEQIKLVEKFFENLHKKTLIPLIERKNNEIAYSGNTLELFSSSINMRKEERTSARIFEHIVLMPMDQDSSISGSAIGKPYLYIECNMDLKKFKIIQSGTTIQEIEITTSSDLNKLDFNSYIDKFLKDEIQ